MSAPAEPLSEPHCSVCGTEVEIGTKRCPSCRTARPGARGADVIGRRGLWMLGVAMLAVYGIVLLIVAAAR
jgi:hypothetical protein